MKSKKTMEAKHRVLSPGEKENILFATIPAIGERQIIIIKTMPINSCNNFLLILFQFN